jgi:hypothetical protein
VAKVGWEVDWRKDKLRQAQLPGLIWEFENLKILLIKNDYKLNGKTKTNRLQFVTGLWVKINL